MFSTLPVSDIPENDIRSAFYQGCPAYHIHPIYWAMVRQIWQETFNGRSTDRVRKTAIGKLSDFENGWYTLPDTSVTMCGSSSM